MTQTPQALKRIHINQKQIKGNIPGKSYQPTIFFRLFQRSEKTRLQKYSKHTLKNYQNLDQSQMMLLKHLSYFSHYKSLIIRMFAQQKISTNMKIYYLDNYSMKLGPYLFNKLENSRQNFMYQLSAWYMYAIGIGAVSFLLFARRTPTHKSLYKQLLLSIGASFIGSGSILMYHKYKYYQTVDQVYDLFRARVKAKFGSNAILKQQNELVQKNFGNTRYNEGDPQAEVDPEAPPIGIFEGGGDSDSKYQISQMMDHFYN